jgi:hypothetical protein
MAPGAPSRIWTNHGQNEGCDDNPNDGRASSAVFAEPANLSREATEVEKQSPGADAPASGVGLRTVILSESCNERTQYQ